jgi:hypothetical protein
MTPQQYDQINGLNALGGCLGFLVVFGLFPVAFVLSGNILFAIIVAVVVFIWMSLWVGKLKSKV